MGKSFVSIDVDWYSFLLLELLLDDVKLRAKSSVGFPLFICGVAFDSKRLAISTDISWKVNMTINDQWRRAKLVTSLQNAAAISRRNSDPVLTLEAKSSL